MQQRLLLEDGTPEAAVDSAAWHLDWSLLRAIARSADTPHEVIWLEPHSQTSIHYIEDFVVRRSYLVVRGEDVLSTLEEIKANLPIVRPVAIWQSLEPEPMCKAILEAGICHWHSENTALLARLLVLSADSSEAVRLAVVTATLYLESVGCVEVLERLAADSSEAVREAARVALVGYRKKWNHA